MNHRPFFDARRAAGSFFKERHSRYNEGMIHLHTRSCGTLLHSPMKISDIVRAAKENGQSHAALTDLNVMFFTMEFFHACQKEGIQPIIGLEVYLEYQEMQLPVLLLAKNNAGLQDLYALSSLISTRQPKSLQPAELAAYARNCWLLNAGGEEYLLSLCEAGDSLALEEYLNTLCQTAGSPDSFAVAVSYNDSSRHAAANRFLQIMAEGLGYRTAALSRIEYEKPEDVQTLQLLRAIDRQVSYEEAALEVRSGRYFRSQQEMEALYTPEQLAMTDEIAASIHLDLSSMPKASLPSYVNRLGLPSSEYLRRLCQAGLKKRLHDEQIPVQKHQEYAERLEYELSVILKMGFADYFLIVYDFIRYGRQQEILVGPGRGSAAGSLVAWCLGITHIDPVANSLLFERFLNPERISMPDIDTDIPDDRRDEIISYVAKTYGQNHVAHIVTFATMKAKMALRDAGRALHVELRDVEKLTKLIGNAPGTTLQSAYQSNLAFGRMVHSRTALENLFAKAQKIEGLPRHTSVHAGGIVFSAQDISRYAPLIDVGFSLPAVQFTMEYLEELGLIKFDFLGLRNLSVIDGMNRAIARRMGRKLDLFHLPLNDPKVFELLCRGDTLGVFQLESEGIRQLILNFQPHRFEDIAAILALYRPGPMQNIQLYLKARHNGGAQVLHPLLEPVLKESGGIFLYQEQIMKAAQIIGGFSLAQADSLRKAMSKKNHEVMESYRSLFVQGASEKQIPESEAAQIFSVMERFADYGFNKSHSYAYGLVVYWMAYIKANYPVEFYGCSLNAVIGSPAKTAAYLKESAGRSLPILPVSLNHSQGGYTLQKQGIRMPFSLIKGISKTVYTKILEERKERGPFGTVAQAVARLNAAGLNRGQLEALIKGGALDEFGSSRTALIESLERLIQYGQMVRVETEEVLFAYDVATPPEISRKPDDPLTRLAWEHDVYGFYMGEHPAAGLRRRYPRTIPLKQARTGSGYMQVLGVVSSLHPHKTKQGMQMCFVTLEDEEGSLDAAIMPELYARIRADLERDSIVLITGKKNRENSILANQIEFLKLT